MGFFQPPYQSQRPEICMDPSGNVSFQPAPVVQLTQHVRSVPGSPFENSPMRDLAAVPQAVWASSLIARTRNSGIDQAVGIG